MNLCVIKRLSVWPVLMLIVILQGCGLVYDAVELIYPLTRDELSSICSRSQLRVGISVEPFRPFVFPAVYTDEGIRVTGLDVELIREIADALTAHCGGATPIVPVLYLTRFPDLFIKMNEGQLDLFISSVSGTVPGASPARPVVFASLFSRGWDRSHHPKTRGCGTSLVAIP